MDTGLVDVASILRHRKREARIEDLLFAYPYLIHPGLKNPRRQRWLSPGSRADLYFETPGKIVLVEIKRGCIDEDAVDQILRYRKEITVTGCRFQGLLVGRSVSDAALVRIRKLKQVLCYLELGRDVPTRIVICKSCRQARDARVSRCPHDATVDVL